MVKQFQCRIHVVILIVNRMAVRRLPAIPISELDISDINMTSGACIFKKS